MGSTSATSAPCPAGRFGASSGLGTFDCDGPAATGFWTSAAATAATQNACAAGRFGGSAGLSTAACTGACSAGFYCPAASTSTTQNACPPGTFGATTGLGTAACSGQCAAGSWCPAQSLSATANTCPAGVYGATAGLGTSTCSGACPLAYYCAAGTVTPVACPGGTVGQAQGLQNAACSAQCSAGSFCPPASSAQQPCPPGRYGATLALASSACSGVCEAGFWCSAGATNATQNMCSGGKWGGTGSTNSSCSGTCRAGYTCARGSTAEAPCPAGTHNPSAAADSTSACVPCGAGSASSAGAAACERCPPWTLSVSTACAPCPPNTYCDGTISQPCVADGRCAGTGCARGYSGVLCSACASGYYATTLVTVTAGSQTCQECPNNLAQSLGIMVLVLLALLSFPSLIYVKWVDFVERRVRCAACSPFFLFCRDRQRRAKVAIDNITRTRLIFFTIESHVSRLILLNSVSSVPYPDFLRRWLFQTASAAGFNPDVAHPECANVSWSSLNTWQCVVVGSILATLLLMFMVGMPQRVAGEGASSASSASNANTSGTPAKTPHSLDPERCALIVFTDACCSHSGGSSTSSPRPSSHGQGESAVALPVHEALTSEAKGKTFIIAYVEDARGNPVVFDGFTGLGALSSQPGTSFVYNGKEAEPWAAYVRPSDSLPVPSMLWRFFASVLLLRSGQFSEDDLWWKVWLFLLKQVMQRSLKVMSYTTVGGALYMSYDLSQRWWVGNPTHQAIFVCSVLLVTLSVLTVAIEVGHSRFWEPSQATRIKVDAGSGERVLVEGDAQGTLTTKAVPLTATQRLKARLEVIGNVQKLLSAGAILYGPFGHLSASIHLIVFSALELGAVMYLLRNNPDRATAYNGSAAAGQDIRDDQYFAEEVRTFLAAIGITTLTVLLGLACAMSEAIRLSNAVGWAFLLLNALFFFYCLAWVGRKVCFRSERKEARQGSAAPSQVPSNASRPSARDPQAASRAAAAQGAPKDGPSNSSSSSSSSAAAVLPPDEEAADALAGTATAPAIPPPGLRPGLPEEGSADKTQQPVPAVLLRSINVQGSADALPAAADPTVPHLHPGTTGSAQVPKAEGAASPTLPSRADQLPVATAAAPFSAPLTPTSLLGSLGRMLGVSTPLGATTPLSAPSAAGSAPLPVPAAALEAAAVGSAMLHGGDFSDSEASEDSMYGDL